jgi:hypothetical protein
LNEGTDEEKNEVRIKLKKELQKNSQSISNKKSQNDEQLKLFEKISELHQQQYNNMF